MDKYYRHYKGRLYRLLHIAAIEAAPDRKAVIYQAMYGDAGIWMRPYENFFESVQVDGKSVPRFLEIPEEEALKDIPMYLQPRFHFPDLAFTPEVPPLTRPGKGGFSSSVAGMIHLMVNSGIVDSALFEGLEDDDDLEREALSRIRAFRKGDDPEPVFHLIQAWGGMAGRGIYVHRETWKKEAVMEAYAALIDACERTTAIDDGSLAALLEAVRVFDRKVKHMGFAFITKHTRFWLTRPLGDNALPICDSIMAKTILDIPFPEAGSIADYWKVMYSKAQHLGISLTALERQIFIYAFENR